MYSVPLMSHMSHVNGASGLTGKNAWQAMVAEYETRRTSQGLPLTWNVLFLESEKLGGSRGV